MSHWTSHAVSRQYEAFRPHYPAAMLAYLAALAPDAAAAAAVDVGCGTGQILRGVAAHFARAVGVDPSATQIASAFAAPNVAYLCAGAEDFAIDAARDLGGAAAAPPVRLITCAQTMHWLDVPAFGERAWAHLAVPGAAEQPGRLAVAFFPTPRLHPPACDAVLQAFDAALHAGGHWPPERRHIDALYAPLVPQLAGRFRAVEQRVFDDARALPLAAVAAYVATWSGTQRLADADGGAARVAAFEEELAAALADHRAQEPAPVVGADGDGADPATVTMTLQFHVHVFAPRD
jgi:SAM-dependent methyltransferase